MLNFMRHGAGPALVLQHGFLGGSGYFTPQMAAFGHMYDVIVPDLPGFAGSADEPVARTFADFSRAQIALLDELGIETFSLLGHSMGGMIALQTALDFPERVDRLILYATASSGDLPERFETFEENLQRILDQGLENTAAAVTASWFVDGSDAPMYGFCADAGRGSSLEAVESCLKEFPAWSVADRLDELEMPTLVVGGDADRSYSVDGMVTLAKSIDNASLGLIPECAHCAHLEKPDLFNALIGSFLSKAV